MTPPDPPPADDGFADSPVSVCVPESCELDKSAASDDTPTDSDESIAPFIETPTGPAVAGSLTVLSWIVPLSLSLLRRIHGHRLSIEDQPVITSCRN